MEHQTRAARFSALHRPGDPFLLPCAWDAASAALLSRSGFPAVGTTSLGLAAALGLRDESRAILGATAALVEVIRTTSPEVLLTCDAEDGFSDQPAEVAETLLPLPVDGVNLEDSTGGLLLDPDLHARKIAAVKASRPDLFVNARVDTYWTGRPDLAETCDRVSRYVAAGADGIFVPGDLAPAVVEQVVRHAGVPVNLLASPHLDLTQLAALGVARVSTGSLLYRTALTRAVDRARELVGEAVLDGEVLGYDAVQALGRNGARPGSGQLP
ncbi:isocitrate lyase/PEP mutase family protein [Nocardioides daejeonensis]|uniref:isocitrate lyase/PEP mutase family protein n=1 Tax=Nocardioides daejeonensis TaxID=1046556 RepID=UPI000D745A02|nr:isocitrate lyase/phosphoenolpyruvate mutase family protein [Nocardioides daejeonensis]